MWIYPDAYPHKETPFPAPDRRNQLPIPGDEKNPGRLVGQNLCWQLEKIAAIFESRITSQKSHLYYLRDCEDYIIQLTDLQYFMRHLQFILRSYFVKIAQ